MQIYSILNQYPTMVELFSIWREY